MRKIISIMSDYMPNPTLSSPDVFTDSHNDPLVNIIRILLYKWGYWGIRRWGT